jgi:hypothetical protein
MAHFLDASQLAEACAALELDETERALVAACDNAGKAIAQRLGVKVVSDASNQPGFGGLCVGFGPLVDGDKCPAELLDYDSSSDWASYTRKPDKWPCPV